MKHLRLKKGQPPLRWHLPQLVSFLFPLSMFILSLFVSALIYGCMDGEHDKEKGKEGKSD